LKFIHFFVLNIFTRLFSEFDIKLIILQVSLLFFLCRVVAAQILWKGGVQVMPIKAMTQLYLMCWK